MVNSLSDEELVVLVQKGDEVAFSELMQRYTGKLLRYGRKIISKDTNIGDTVQDVFVTVYKNIKDFDASRKFSPWIYRIAHNAFVDVIRKKAKEPLNIFDVDMLIPHPTYKDPLIKEKEFEETRVLLEKSLEKLPPSYREIIDLYYYENFSYKEIADILHIPIGTVGIRLSRARDVIKSNFPKQDYE